MTSETANIMNAWRQYALEPSWPLTEIVPDQAATQSRSTAIQHIGASTSLQRVMSNWTPGHHTLKVTLAATVAQRIRVENATEMIQALNGLLDRLIPNLRTLDKFMTSVRKQVHAQFIANDDENSWHIVK
jgi:hypothetical protein